MIHAQKWEHAILGRGDAQAGHYAGARSWAAISSGVNVDEFRNDTDIPRAPGLDGIVKVEARSFFGCVGCPRCRATHGAHADGSPLGIPANAETQGEVT